MKNENKFVSLALCPILLLTGCNQNAETAITTPTETTAETFIPTSETATETSATTAITTTAEETYVENRNCDYWGDGLGYGMIYTGEWKNGLPNGKGCATWEYGDSYDGYWVDGKLEGEGTYTWANGDVYTGMHKANLQEGKGVKTTKHYGTRYEGEFKNALYDGEGTLGFTLFEKVIFSGKWKEGKPDVSLGNDERTTAYLNAMMENDHFVFFSNSSRRLAITDMNGDNIPEIYNRHASVEALSFAYTVDENGEAYQIMPEEPSSYSDCYTGGIPTCYVKDGVRHFYTEESYGITSVGRYTDLELFFEDNMIKIRPYGGYHYSRDENWKYIYECWLLDEENIMDLEEYEAVKEKFINEHKLDEDYVYVISETDEMTYDEILTRLAEGLDKFYSNILQ